MSVNKNTDAELSAALKGIYDSLTDEQKEKAKNCKTIDELVQLAAENGMELPDEALESVAGGVPLCDACRDKEPCGSYSVFDYFC